MKRLLLPVVCGLMLLSGCQRFNIGPKGEGEYVIGSATIAYSENDGKLKRNAMKAAEADALDKAVRVFLSSSSKVNFPQSVKREILDKPQNYIRKTFVETSYRKGSSYYMEVRSMILVSDLSAKIKELEEASYVKKTNIYVASRDIALDQISLKQYCRQGIYQAFKSQPYTLIDGGNLSDNNLENYNPIIDKAKQAGARFVVLADASANKLSSASQITTSFTPIRAMASVKVIAVNNYQIVAQGSGSGSGLDPVEDISVQKAFLAACEQGAAATVDDMNKNINSAKTFTFVFTQVNTIERLQRLQEILQALREVEDFSLIKYKNSDATFEVQANVSNVEELAAKIIRTNYSNFSILETRPDRIKILFL